MNTFLNSVSLVVSLFCWPWSRSATSLKGARVEALSFRRGLRGSSRPSPPMFALCCPASSGDTPQKVARRPSSTHFLRSPRSFPPFNPLLRLVLCLSRPLSSSCAWSFTGGGGRVCVSFPPYRLWITLLSFLVPKAPLHRPLFGPSGGSTDHVYVFEPGATAFCRRTGVRGIRGEILSGSEGRSPLFHSPFFPRVTIASYNLDLRVTFPSLLGCLDPQRVDPP